MVTRTRKSKRSRRRKPATNNMYVVEGKITYKTNPTTKTEANILARKTRGLGGTAKIRKA